MTAPRATRLRWMAARWTASKERPMTRAAPKPTAVPIRRGARLGTPHAMDATAHQTENAQRATRTVRSPGVGRRRQATAMPASSRGKTQASGRKKAPLRIRAAAVIPAATAPRVLRWRRSTAAADDDPLASARLVCSTWPATVTSAGHYCRERDGYSYLPGTSGLHPRQLLGLVEQALDLVPQAQGQLVDGPPRGPATLGRSRRHDRLAHHDRDLHRARQP